VALQTKAAYGAASKVTLIFSMRSDDLGNEIITLVALS
jgi:hypothetical protein